MNPYQLARAALDKKQLSVADRGFSAILKKTPNHWQALRDLGTVRLHQARFDDAEKLLRRSIEAKPDVAETRRQLGELLIALGRREDGVAELWQAVRVDAECIGAWNSLQIALEHLGRGHETVEALETATQALPGSLNLHLCLGNAYGQVGRHPDAERACARARQLSPGNVIAEVQYANALFFQNRLDEALMAYERVLVAEPTHLLALVQRSNCLFNSNRYAEAISAFTVVLNVDPNCYDALVGLGAVLCRVNRLEEALTFLQAALHANPKGVVGFNNLGHVMAALKDDADAVILLDRVHELQPDSKLDARLTAATSMLRLGNYPEGFRRYESRFEFDKRHVIAPAKFAGAKRWQGEALNGRTLLVIAEQGHGDSVQFARFLPMLARSVNGQVIFAVQAAVQPLLEPQVAQWAPAGNLTLRNEHDVLPPCDLFVALMSLPLILGTRIDTIPTAPHYLSAPDAYRRKWATALPETGKLRVGVAWAGSTIHANDHNRSMPIIHLAPLLGDASVDWYVIQPGLTVSDQLSLKTVPHVRNPGEQLRDFADTAALIEQLDVVVAVDTAVAHLAGALGKPTWLMLTWAAEWRWLHERRDSPWYPSARLFRQPKPGDWDGVIEQVQQGLIEFETARCAALAA